MQDVERRQGKDGAGNDDARACAYGLDDDVLAQWVLDFAPVAEAYGYDSDGYGGLEYLADFEPEVCGSGAEYHCQNQAHDDGVGRDFGVLARGVHHGTIVLVFAEFAEGVFGQVDGVGVRRRTGLRRGIRRLSLLLEDGIWIGCRDFCTHNIIWN